MMSPSVALRFSRLAAQVFQQLENARKAAELKVRVDALPASCRLKVRTSGGMFEVTYVGSWPAKEAVAIVFDDGCVFPVLLRLNGARADNAGGAGSDRTSSGRTSSGPTAPRSRRQRRTQQRRRRPSRSGSRRTDRWRRRSGPQPPTRRRQFSLSLPTRWRAPTATTSSPRSLTCPTRPLTAFLLIFRRRTTLTLNRIAPTHRCTPTTRPTLLPTLLLTVTLTTAIPLRHPIPATSLTPSSKVALGLRRQERQCRRTSRTSRRRPSPRRSTAKLLDLSPTPGPSRSPSLPISSPRLLNRTRAPRAAPQDDLPSWPRTPPLLPSRPPPRTRITPSGLSPPSRPSFVNRSLQHRTQRWIRTGCSRSGWALDRRFRGRHRRMEGTRRQRTPIRSRILERTLSLGRARRRGVEVGTSG